MITALAPAQAVSADPVHRQQCLEQAARCRRQASFISDPEAADQLLSMAADLERDAWLARSAR
jgi:hypothetical protein